MLLLLALIWGVHWPISKIGLRDLPPFTYGSLRVATGMAVIVAVLAARRGIRRPARQDLPIVLSVGLGQMAGGIALMNLALPMIAAGRSSILFYTMPLWVAVVQLPALRAGGARRQLGGLALGLLGIGLLLHPGAIDWGSQGALLGSAGLLLGAMIWGLTTVQLRHHRWAGNPLDLEPWQLLVALVPLVAGALVLEPGRAVHWTPAAVGAVLFSGLLATALAYWLSQSVSRRLSPLATTMGLLVAPVAGLLSSWLLLGEPLTPLDAAAAGVTFLGIVVVTVDANAREPRAVPIGGDPLAAPPAIGEARAPLRSKP